MAMLDPLGSFTRVPDVAEYCGVSVATARRWFETKEKKAEDRKPLPGVVSVPSGSKQKPRYYVPDAVIWEVFGPKGMNFQETMIQGLLDRRRAVPVNPAPPVEPPKAARKKNKSIRKPVASASGKRRVPQTRKKVAAA